MDVTPPAGDFLLHLGGAIQNGHGADVSCDVVRMPRSCGIASFAMLGSHRLNSTQNEAAGKLPGRHLANLPIEQVVTPRIRPQEALAHAPSQMDPDCRCRRAGEHRGHSHGIGQSGIAVRPQGRPRDRTADAFKRWFPASLTKLMTAYVTFKAIEAGELKLDRRSR
jgi:hypothetical protein